MNLGRLLLLATGQPAPEGNISGVCVVCALETNHGVPLKRAVSDNFTGWNRFFSGNCMCPECAFLFSDQTFRKKSWAASLSSGFRTFKNDEAQSVLFSPPDPPFFIHIAKQGQRQTWLSCLHKVASNPNWYFFSHENYDVPILFERARAEEYAAFVAEALAFGLTKTELSSGQFKMKSWHKAYQEGRQDFLRRLAAFKGNPLWEVICDVARRGKAGD